MEPTDRPVVVTGIKPTGPAHLGNYLGMIRPALALAAHSPAFVFVADGHAMTSVVDAGELRNRTYEVAASLLALGLDPSETALYRQTDVPEVFELAWLLACVTPKGLLNRAHAYKAAIDDNRRAGRPDDEAISAGLLTYPVLMAADILAVGGDTVPVGRDQAQHLEITRDLATTFNRGYGPALTVPDAAIDPSVETIIGTDGRKMSKSYDNVLALFAPPDETRRRIRGIVTDSRFPNEPKDPDTCRVFTLYRYLAPPEQVVELDRRYRAGGVAYGEVKHELAARFEERFGPARQRFADLVDHRPYLDEVLAAGGRRARERAARVLASVRTARGAAA